MSMWFKRGNTKSANGVKPNENGVAGKTRRKVVVDKAAGDVVDGDKDKRRHSDIINIKTALERRESDESLYESADGQSDVISASEDTIPRSGKFRASKESARNSIAEETEAKPNKGHRKTLSLSNPLEMVKTLGDEWLDVTKRDSDKNSDKKKSRESLWSEEDRDSLHGSNAKLNEKKNRKNDKKTSMEPPKSTKRVSSVSALNFLRRKRKTIEPVAEKEDRVTATREDIATAAVFLEAEIRYACECEAKIVVSGFNDDDKDDGVESGEDLDAEDEESEETSSSKPVVTPSKRRISRTISRSKSKSRGKSQTVRVNALRKSQSGTLKRAKKKKVKAGTPAKSRNMSVTDTPVRARKLTENKSSSYWPFSGSTKGEARREGSAIEAAAASAPDAVDVTRDSPLDRDDAKDRVREPAAGKPLNRAESCREPAAASRRGKQRNASDPNRLTTKTHEGDVAGAGAGGAREVPSASSSGSSLSTFSDGADKPDAHGSQSEFSEEEEPLAEAWSASVPAALAETLCARLRKRQELIHELITSESSHVRWLKVLHVVFLRPLEREAGALLPPEDVRALFPNLPAVRERHNRLYADLKALRRAGALVPVGAVAEAVLNTLGDPSYSKVLSRFCCGQRMALDALRERRRKNKDLHHYLCIKEQHRLCGRLQLRDLMAIVWQRLTKYQLLLEGVLRTISDSDDEAEVAADPQADELALLRRALDTAKDVLHRVDTAIRLAENQHRLKTIQSRLEVRGAGGEADELRRLDLTQHRLVFEADLSIRSDNKKTTLLGVMTPEYLILLHREGDKYVLKQMSQLTPIIKWSTVLFRPNAAVKNTFFLMNINGVQMYQLSANSLSEYNAWTKYISEMPLAEGRAVRASSVLHNRERTDDSSGGVSRNASDASRTSASSGTLEAAEPAPDPAPDQGAECGGDKQEEPDEKPEREKSASPPPVRPQLTANGRITTHACSPPPLACARAEAAAGAAFAARALSGGERLRRLDRGIADALHAKSALVGELLGAPRGAAEAPEPSDDADVQQLLLAAHAQASQIMEALSRALSVSETGVVAARAHATWRRSGLCDRCNHREKRQDSGGAGETETRDAIYTNDAATEPEPELQKEMSFDMLAELDPGGSVGAVDGSERAEGGGVRLEEIGESSTDPDVRADGVGEASLARRLTPLASALHILLGRLLVEVPSLHDENRRLRQRLASWRDRADASIGLTREPREVGEADSPRAPADEPARPDETSGG